MSFVSFGVAQGVSRDIAWRVERWWWEVDRSTSTARLQIATFVRVAGTIIEQGGPSSSCPFREYNSVA
jgi:hypothetical protein